MSTFMQRLKCRLGRHDFVDLEMFPRTKWKAKARCSRCGKHFYLNDNVGVVTRWRAFHQMELERDIVDEKYWKAYVGEN